MGYFPYQLVQSIDLLASEALSLLSLSFEWKTSINLEGSENVPSANPISPPKRKIIHLNHLMDLKDFEWFES